MAAIAAALYHPGAGGRAERVTDVMYLVTRTDAQVVALCVSALLVGSGLIALGVALGRSATWVEGVS